MAQSNCRRKSQSAPDFIQDTVTYKGGVINKFDFNMEPLASDITLLNSGVFDDYIVKNQSIIDSIGSKRNYYKLFYYSKVFEKEELVAVLGFYDYYYDVVLLSIDNGTLIDWALIASIEGDAEDFDEVSSKITSDSTIDVSHVVGRRDFSKPDSLIIRSKIDERIFIKRDGSFDSIILRED